MAYSYYAQKFADARIQHNIMAIVGNGFDIQALQDLGEPHRTTYTEFYEYLSRRRFDPSNPIFAKMGQLKADGYSNWSDVENAIADLAREQMNEKSIRKATKSIQLNFAEFLAQIARPEVLMRLGELSEQGQLARASLAGFLGDIEAAADYNSMYFSQTVNIGDILNFRFVNLNYTTLLDDYIYLGDTQFDPHPFGGSDRNFHFRPNPRGHINETLPNESASFQMVCYLLSDVSHPHGVMYTPRSLLFGVDEATTGRINRLAKSYWGQSDIKYGSTFQEVTLFLIFGCSLGPTDGWWWRGILYSMARNKWQHLVIYEYTAPGHEQVKESVLERLFRADVDTNLDDAAKRRIYSQTTVVFHGPDSPQLWLSTSRDSLPEWAPSLTR